MEIFDISNSIFYAGFPPVGVSSACICVLTVSENVIKMSGEIFRKCLYPKQTDSVDN